MTPEELLVKRFKTLVGQVPFNWADPSPFIVSKDVTYEEVKSHIEGFWTWVPNEELEDYYKLSNTDRLLYLIDNVVSCRMYIRKLRKED